MLLARRLRDALRRHPWFLDHVGSANPSYGPNGGHYVEQALRSMAGLNLTIDDRLDIMESIWEYVLGFCYSEHQPPAVLSAGMQRYVATHSTSGQFRELAAILAQHDAATLTASRRRSDQRFERNLSRLLDSLAR
jgi:hypothetical protein